MRVLCFYFGKFFRKKKNRDGICYSGVDERNMNFQLPQMQQYGRFYKKHEYEVINFF